MPRFSNRRDSQNRPMTASSVRTPTALPNQGASMAIHILFRRGINSFQRLRELLFEFGMRQGQAWQHGIALGGVADKDSHNDGRLLHVWFGEALISIEICVCAAGLVVAGILDELESRETDLNKGEVIGGPGITQRDRGEAEIADRGYPLLENRSDCRVSFGENTQKPASAIVGIEVGIELRMLRFGRDWPGLLTEKNRYDLLLRFGRVGLCAEMIA